jgi:hypothetical protein
VFRGLRSSSLGGHAPRRLTALVSVCVVGRAVRWGGLLCSPLLFGYSCVRVLSLGSYIHILSTIHFSWVKSLLGSCPCFPAHLMAALVTGSPPELLPSRRRYSSSGGRRRAGCRHVARRHRRSRDVLLSFRSIAETSVEDITGFGAQVLKPVESPIRTEVGNLDVAVDIPTPADVLFDDSRLYDMSVDDRLGVIWSSLTQLRSLGDSKSIIGNVRSTHGITQRGPLCAAAIDSSPADFILSCSALPRVLSDGIGQRHTTTSSPMKVTFLRVTVQPFAISSPCVWRGMLSAFAELCFDVGGLWCLELPAPQLHRLMAHSFNPPDQPIRP